MGLALVKDLREFRTPMGDEEIADFETDVLAGFVLARAAAGLTDGTIRSDTNHLELIRDWFGKPLWEMQPPDADTYFGKVLREARPATRTGRAGALAVYFQFLELRHKVEDSVADLVMWTGGRVSQPSCDHFAGVHQSCSIVCCRICQVCWSRVSSGLRAWWSSGRGCARDRPIAAGARSRRRGCTDGMRVG